MALSIGQAVETKDIGQFKLGPFDGLAFDRRRRAEVGHQ